MVESPERIIEPVYKIYPALLQDMDNQVDCLHKYDLIVLDEFHHGGADMLKSIGFEYKGKLK